MESPHSHNANTMKSLVITTRPFGNESRPQRWVAGPPKYASKNSLSSFWSSYEPLRHDNEEDHWWKVRTIVMNLYPVAPGAEIPNDWDCNLGQMRIIRGFIPFRECNVIAPFILDNNKLPYLWIECRYQLIFNDRAQIEVTIKSYDKLTRAQRKALEFLLEDIKNQIPANLPSPEKENNDSTQTIHEKKHLFQQEMKTILCIDIGGTRIKSAVLPQYPDIQQARNAPHMVVRTLGWLNQSLPSLLDPNHWPSLAAYYKKIDIDYDSVAISVPGVVENGIFMRSDLVSKPSCVPRNLLSAMQNKAGCPLTLIKDADAWMMGYQSYSRALGINVHYPALLLAFGTGFGIAVAADSNTVYSIEAGDMSVTNWNNVFQASGHHFSQGWEIHRIVGRSFFDWVDHHKKHWDHTRIRDEFSKRVKAALEDILPWIEKRLGKRVQTVALAGGNAEYVSVRVLESTGRTIVSLTDRLSKLDPDLITVMGVAASTYRECPRKF